MKCLSVMQPHATLIASGAKKFETRGKPTGYRGRLAIQASKTFPKDAQAACFEEPFRSALKAAGCTGLKSLWLGAVVGVVELTGCEKTEDVLPAIASTEARFGDYSPGRFAWKCERAVQLPTPICVRGELAIFELPAIVVVDVAAQLRELAEKILEGEPALTTCRVCGAAIGTEPHVWSSCPNRTAAEIETWHERAAVYEFDAGLERVEAEARARADHGR